MDSIEVVNAKTHQAYNLAAQKYHELFQDEMNQKEYDRKLLDRFALSFGKASLICDAGCGPSRHIGQYLFDKGIPVLGVDLADRCVELAREHIPRMRFERCDMAELPFDDETSMASLLTIRSSLPQMPRRAVLPGISARPQSGRTPVGGDESRDHGRVSDRVAGNQNGDLFQYVHSRGN